MAAVTSKTLKLANGYTIPVVGLGTWQSKPGEVQAAVEAAIDAGYRHIDCAYVYGNEKEIGEALKKKIDEGVDRKELFITSKLWNTKHAAADVRPALLQTLKDLQLDYLDLYLIHWPIAWQPGNVVFPRDESGALIYSDIHYKETWPEMEKAVDDGLVRSIGLSNFNSQQIDEVVNMARIQPTMLQVEVHPYLVQNELINHCKKHNMLVTAFSPLGSPDRPWAKPGEPLLLEDPKLIEIGKKYKKSPAQVCIRYQVQRGLSVIPKSAQPERIKQNADVFDFELSEEDMKVIESFNRPWRACKPMIERDGVMVERDAHHSLYPFNIPY
ncbi:aldo-keto reductase family 1 member A1-like [Hydractinia symbiolongicarpus]|uniref:aldo-keto reductase family 1 member A1-like n=1 Tax=Hydractinia symbiolongicarpus TaxID=13093 RepID=UPI00254DEE65|nr:aldo-keto reductase family 1 member A1-like [Hydractinia symbiolongicarpus]XP_057298972.1 aldo-keto reductase family 1 member A1-like [Hydractinia symbiolongicarpus]